MSPIDKTLAAIQAECVALRKITGRRELRLEGLLDTILDMIDVLAAELRVISSVLERGYSQPANESRIGHGDLTADGKEYAREKRPEYRCPICGGGPHSYLSCNYPNCPDGRDH
jgi:hypothetical protein